MELSIILEKIVAIYLLVGGVAILINGKSLLRYAEEMLSGSLSTFVVAPLALVFGLVIVLTHNTWSGGVVTVTTTFVGWAALVKGILIFILPTSALGSLMRPLNSLSFYRIAGVLGILIGVYMSTQLF